MHKLTSSEQRLLKAHKLYVKLNSFEFYRKIWETNCVEKRNQLRFAQWRASELAYKGRSSHGLDNLKHSHLVRAQIEQANQAGIDCYI